MEFRARIYKLKGSPGIDSGRLGTIPGPLKRFISTVSGLGSVDFPCIFRWLFLIGAGIFKKSMGARHRVGIDALELIPGLHIRLKIRALLRSPRIDSASLCSQSPYL